MCRNLLLLVRHRMFIDIDLLVGFKRLSELWIVPLAFALFPLGVPWH